jgi:hypothetical protein
MLAYTWPLLSLFWTFLMFAGISLLLFFVIFCFVDNFRRRDHQGLVKAGWTLLIPARALRRRPHLHRGPAGGRATGFLKARAPAFSGARFLPGLPGDGEMRVSPGARRWLSFGPQGNVQEPEMQNHHPRVSQRPDRAWVVECAQCRNDLASSVPIGIGMPLRDRETAERLRDNHAARLVRAAAS